MPEEKSRTHEQINADLNARLGATLAAYAEEHGLTQEEVMRTARELLLSNHASEGEA